MALITTHPPVRRSLAAAAAAIALLGGAPARAEGITADPQAPTGRIRAARVIIISEDGLRGDAIQQQRLPFHETLYKNGSYSWKARTIRTASTLPAHAAM